MVSLAMRVGISFAGTPCGELAARLGRPVSVLVGIVMFLIIASFQSSNNVAVAGALEAFDVDASEWLRIAILFSINAIVISFLYFSRQRYRTIEFAMKMLVLLMVIAFLVNCVMARPSLVETARGLIPAIPREGGLLIVALVATTFSVAAAFYQAYLVREKHWTKDDYRSGQIDSVIGIATLGCISVIIMITSAAVFYGQDDLPAFEKVHDVALQLKPLFGVGAQLVFGIGIFAAAISSFLVNALIGGQILADGLGLGDKLESRWTQHFTTLALVVGLLVAVFAIGTGNSTFQLIIFAQALTVVGGPALAAALLYLGIIIRTANKTAMPIWIIILAGAGFLTTCLLAVRTVFNIIEKLS